MGGTLTAKAGYSWDGASGGCPDNDYTLTPSMFHDIPYQMMRLGLMSQEFRPMADRLFYTQIRDRGLNRVIAWFFYIMVRRFGAPSADPVNKKEVLFAP